LRLLFYVFGSQQAAAARLVQIARCELVYLHKWLDKSYQ
jgi:hypothetical protein